MSDLRERDVELYEDGKRQAVRLFQHEDLPITAGLVVDHSGSMRNFDSSDPDRNLGVPKQLAKATGVEAYFPMSLPG